MSEHTARPRPSSIRFDPLTGYSLSLPQATSWCVFCDAAPCEGTTPRCCYGARQKRAYELSREAALERLRGNKPKSKMLMQQHAEIGLMGAAVPDFGQDD